MGEINQIACCDWLPERVDGAILPARDYPLFPARKFSRKPNNKSFIDQAFSVKMGGYGLVVCLRELMDLDSVSGRKRAK